MAPTIRILSPADSEYVADMSIAVLSHIVEDILQREPDVEPGRRLGLTGGVLSAAVTEFILAHAAATGQRPADLLAKFTAAVTRLIKLRMTH